MNPKVSIIVPIYNTEKYLTTCLDSILNQSYKNLEIILINDGSTDNSPILAKAYQEKDSRIKLIHQKNAGLSSARNTGIEHATGDFFTFIDSDDEISPKMLEKMVKAIETSKADVAVCSFKEIYPNGKTIHFNSRNYPKNLFNTKEALENMLLEKGFMLSSTMKLFPKNFFKEISFPVGKLHEDVGTTYQLIMQAEKIVFLPEELYYYHHRSDSIISEFNEQKFDLITLTDQMCNDIDKNYPDLINITKERRMRTRFSLLRQIPLKHPKTKTLLNYLKINQSFIIDNPSATKTDKLALKLALKNVKLFQISYKLFK